MDTSPNDRRPTPNEGGTPHRKRPSSSRISTRRMVTCAILCALSVVILSIGALLQIIDLTSAAMAAVVILLIYLSYGGRYALLSYAVTSVLGVILMPQSLAVWGYVGLMGYYPVVKNRFDRLPRFVGWLVKICLFALIMGACLIIFHFLVMGGEGDMMASVMQLLGEGNGRSYMVWAVLGISLVTFVIFDLLLDRLTFLYHIRFRRRVEKWMK